MYHEKPNVPRKAQYTTKSPLYHEKPNVPRKAQYTSLWKEIFLIYYVKKTQKLCKISTLYYHYSYVMFVADI